MCNESRLSNYVASDVTEKTPVFTAAYTAAWGAISGAPAAINADTAIWLAAFIRSRIVQDEGDPAVIAAQAVKAFAKKRSISRRQ